MYNVQILADLANPDFKFNKPELMEENSLQVLTVYESIYSFIQSMTRLYQERSELIGNLAFTKDDDLIVDFVSAATNLRAFNFSINSEVSLVSLI